jgi:hypothetical protein
MLTSVHPLLCEKCPGIELKMLKRVRVGLFEKDLRIWMKKRYWGTRRCTEMAGGSLGLKPWHGTDLKAQARTVTPKTGITKIQASIKAARRA